MTSKQRAAFRRQANTVAPIFQIGKGGITKTVIAQADEALTARELIKIKVLLETTPIVPKQAAQELSVATNADIIQVIGGTIVLYRYNPKLHEKKKKPAKKK